MMSARQPLLRIFWHRCPGATIRSTYQANPIPSWRLFTSSAHRRSPAAKQASRVPRYPASAPKSSSFKPGNIGKLALKVARDGDVVLFKAPSQKAYMFGAYSLGALCFTYSVWQSNNVFGDPVMAFPMWQQGLFAGVCVIMSALGTVVLSRTTNMVRTITAIQSGGHIAIRFTVRRLVPFMKPYTFEVLPSQVNISRRLVVSPQSMERYKNDNLKMGATTDRKLKWWNPVEVLSRSIWRLFISMRQIFTSEDFILLQVEGRKQTFRMDSNGFVAEEFLALGDPVKVGR